MIALAALALAAGEVPTAVLRPVLDRPYRLTVSEERGIEGRVFRFSAERRLVFHREGGGFLAEVTLLRVSQDIGGAAGRRFETALGVLRDRTERFHLGVDGTLVAIDDEAALTTAMIQALHLAGTQSGGMAIDLPPEAAREEIASAVMPVIAGADAGRGPAVHAVHVPPIRPGTSVAPLTGTETIALGADALLHITVHASAMGDDRAVSLDRERRIDRASGLVVIEDETQTIRIGSDVQVTHKRTVLAPPV